jgi:hypothetical protein
VNPTESSGFESSWTPIRSYFGTLRGLLSAPSEFFRKQKDKTDLAGPLAFALVTHWIGEALSFLWRQQLSTLLSRSFADMTTAAGRFASEFEGDLKRIDSDGRHEQIQKVGEQFLHWVWGVGGVLIDPVVTLIQLTFFTVFIFVGARILITPKPGITPPIEFGRVLRICAFATAPALFSMIPVMGPLLASIAGLLLLAIGIENVYGVSRARAVWVASFPYFLISTAFFLLLGAIVYAFFRLMTAFT